MFPAIRTLSNGEKPARGFPWPLLLILALTLLVYGEAGSWDYFQYDDEHFVKNNPMLAQGLTWSAVKWAFTQVEPFVMTTAWLSFLLDVTLSGGPSAAVFHLGNVLFHMINIILLYLVVLGLGQSVWVAFLTTAFFAVHPQHVEAVAWIVERKEVLAFLFGILALGCHVRWVKGNQPSFWRWLAVGFYLVSLMAKPQWVTLPFLLLLLDDWPLGRSSLGWRRLVGEKWPYFALTLLFSLVTTFYYANRNIISGLDEVSLAGRLTNGVLAMAGQLSKTFWPSDLAVIYPALGNFVTMEEVLGYGALLLLLTLAVWWLYRHGQPCWAVGWLWFLGGLFPTLGLVNGGALVGMADRWSYLPHVGFFLTLSAGSEPLLIQYRRRLLAWGGILVVLAVMTLVSREQASLWSESEKMWLATLRSTQPWPNPYVNWLLGMYYQDHNRRQEALPYLEKALMQAPGEAMFMESLLIAYVQQGRGEGIAPLLAALLANPRTTPAMLMSVGEAIRAKGDFSLAVSILSLAVNKPPHFYDKNFAQAMLSLSRAFAEVGDKEKSDKAMNYYLKGMNHEKEHCRHALAVVQEVDLRQKVVIGCSSLKEQNF